MNYTLLDIKQWPRKSAFDFYKTFEDPYFNVSLNIDVTPLHIFAKAKGLSFFLSLMHCCLEAANEVENFRMRWDPDGVRVYNQIHGGSTVLYDDESFGFAYYTFSKDIVPFVKNSEEEIKLCKVHKSFNPQNDKDGLIYFSSLPWLEFTSFKHAQSSGINSSIPRITTGKYFQRASQIFIPINIEVNHALMDGYHVGKFVEILNSKINAYADQDMLH